jgi:hypothetical protein
MGIDEQHLDDMAWQLAEGNLDEVAVRNVVETANRLGVARRAVSVLADPRAPFVARCRAFAIVHHEIHRVTRAPRLRVGAA